MEGKRVTGWAARDASGILSPYSFNLRKTGPEDLMLKVLYCGVDHTDLHQIRGEIGPVNYPLVPWQVMELGSQVKTFEVGDMVGVGCIIWSCGDCLWCKSNMEQLCQSRIFTSNGTRRNSDPGRVLLCHGG